MIKWKNIALLLLVVGVTTACHCKKKVEKRKASQSETTLSKVTVQPGYGEPTFKDPFKILSATIEGDILTLCVTYGGGCEAHEFSAYAGENYMKSMPPKIGVTIEHNANADLCKALVQDTLRFDVSTVKYPGKEKDYTVILNINNWKGDLEYKY